MPPNIAEFRPLTIGQIIDQAITIYRRNFLVFIGIVAVIQIPLSLIQFVVNALPSSLMLGAPSDDSSQMYGALGLVCFGTIATVLGTLVLMEGFGYGALARAVVDYRLGRRSSILEAYRNISPQATRLVATTLLGSIMLSVVIVWILVPCIGWFTGMGMLVFVGAVILPLLAPIVVLEGKSGLGAMRRAWDLSRRRFWWVLGFAFVLTLLGQMIVLGPTLLLSYGLLSTSWLASDLVAQNLLNNAIQIFASAIGGILYTPISVAAYTLMYLDLRVRTEGLDLAVQVAPAEGELSAADLAVTVPLETSGNLLTVNEILYFLGITIGAGVLYVLLMAVFFGVITAFVAASGLD